MLAGLVRSALTLDAGVRRQTVDREILEFTSLIGATEPQPGDQTYSAFRAIFQRSNYFILKGTPANRQTFIIVKISRSKRPFWGLGKEFVDLLNKFDQIRYFLVLLVSSREGWVFSRDDVNANIRSQKWKLREADNNYKINWPLPDANSFSSTDVFLQRVARSGA